MMKLDEDDNDDNNNDDDDDDVSGTVFCSSMMDVVVAILKFVRKDMIANSILFDNY